MDRPSSFPEWATTEVVSPDSNISNIVEPPTSKKVIGWDFKERPARNVWNWVQNNNYKWILHFDYLLNTLRKETDGTGSTLFDVDNTFITLFAQDSTNRANFIKAEGFKISGSAPDLNVISNNTLTLGSGLSDGTQAISGATAGNIVVIGTMIPR